MSKPGHNSKVQAGPVNAERLKSFVERIERLEEERKAIGGDVKDVYSEAKGVGYDVKTMRQIVKERSQDAADRDEQETLLEVYRAALGMGTYRSVAAQYGISKSKLHRLVPREENGTSARKPEDGDDGITESCEGRGVVPECHDNPAPHGLAPSVGAGHDQQTQTVAVRRDRNAPDVGNVAEPETDPESAPRSSPSQDPIPAHANEFPATPFLGDDPGPTPPFLRGSRTGRVA